MTIPFSSRRHSLYWPPSGSNRSVFSICISILHHGPFMSNINIFRNNIINHCTEAPKKCTPCSIVDIFWQNLWYLPSVHPYISMVVKSALYHYLVACETLYTGSEGRKNIKLNATNFGSLKKDSQLSTNELHDF